MKLGSVVIFLLIGFGIYLLTGYSNAAPSCTFRGSCNVGETCIFSVFQQNDSHVGNCSYYNTKVCCNETTSVAVRSGACNSDEGAVLSEYQENNTHVASKDYYGTKVCVKFGSNAATGNVRTSCLTGEGCVASVFQQNDSHVGNCNYYTNKICIRQVFPVTVTVNLNDSNPTWNGGVRVSGTASRSDGTFVDTNPNGLNVYVNNTLYCTNETDSSGNYICDFSAPSQLGNYLANVTVLDPLTSLTWSNTASFIVKAITGQPTSAESSVQSISCYEEPRVVQNPDGTLTVANVRICIWK
ncbi:MAG: hypothetical protein HYW22_02535 [Candidatus Aenigmarchaeota archaeon]|nr:hypothetical protein [Candidatus Aenigmarchaeota archaeon]